jgi:LPXTG-motif cell wall-anchored protein
MVKKINSTVTKNGNFRSWKSGKSWLYASAVVAAVAGVGVSVSLPSKDAAAQLLTTVNTANLTGGTDNTATGGLGSDYAAGENNASFANTTGVLHQDNAATTQSLYAGSATAKPNGALETNNNTNTAGNYTVNSSLLSSAYHFDSTGAINLIVKSGSATLLNANGAIQAGASAASSVSFDVSQTQQVPKGEPQMDIYSNGTYSWVVQAPGDLVDAGISVANTQVVLSANEENVYNGNALTDPNVIMQSDVAVAQTVGGTFTKINESVASDVLLNAYGQGAAVTSYNNAIASATAAGSNYESLAYSAAAAGNSTVASSYAVQAGSALSLASSIALAEMNDPAAQSGVQQSFVATASLATAAELSYEVLANSATLAGNSSAASSYAQLASSYASLASQAAVSSAGYVVLNAQSMATVTINYMGGGTGATATTKLVQGVTDFLNTTFGGVLNFLGGIANVAAFVANGVGDAVNFLSSILSSTLLGNIQLALGNGFKAWASNVWAAAAAVNSVYNEINEAATQGISESFLAEVTETANGTFVVNGGTHGFLQAIVNWIGNEVHDYVTAISNLVGAFVTIPNDNANNANDITIQSILNSIPILRNIAQWAGMTWNHVVEDVQNTIASTGTAVINDFATLFGEVASGVLQVGNESNILTEGAAGLGIVLGLPAIAQIAVVLDGAAGAEVGGAASIPTVTATASVTVGFTANDPSAQISQNLQTAGYYYDGQQAYSGDAQNGVFVPETFSVDPTLNGTTSDPNNLPAGSVNSNGLHPTEVMYTSVVYQYATESDSSTTEGASITTNDTTLNVGDTWTPAAGVNTITDSEGNTVAGSALTWTQASDGTWTGKGTDSAGNVVTVTVIPNQVSTTGPGKSTVNYTVTDAAGQTASAQATVTVVGSTTTTPDTAAKLNVTDEYRYTTQKFDPNEMILNVTNSDGTTGDSSKVTYTVGTATQASDGTLVYPITFSYTDPSGATVTATANFYNVPDYTGFLPSTPSSSTSSSSAASTAAAAAMTLANASSTAATQLPINQANATNPYTGTSPVYTTTPGGLYSYPAYNYAEDSFGDAGYLDGTTGVVGSSEVAILTGSSTASSGAALLAPASYFINQTASKDSVPANVVAAEFTPAGTTTGQAISTTAAVTAAQAGTYTYIAAVATSAGQLIYSTYTITVPAATDTITGSLAGHDSSLTVGDTWNDASNLDSVTINGTTYTATNNDWSSAGIPSGYQIDESDNVNTAVAGTYQVTYTLTDANGNSLATITQNVTVNAATVTTPSSSAPESSSSASSAVSSATSNVTSASSKAPATSSAKAAAKVLPSTGDDASSEVIAAAGAALLAGAATLEVLRRRNKKNA